MSKFSYDVVADILHRLPVKPLLRFRCLSKYFCSLIDDPDFIRRHLHHSLSTKSNQGLVLKDWNLYTVDFDSLSVAVEFNYHPMHAGGGTEVVGSINGIIVLRHSERNLGIYNIATRKFKPLPVSEIEPPNRSFKTGYVFYGFGHDSVGDDYKLLRMGSFVGDDDDNEYDAAFEYDYDVSVYSLRTNSWKKITNVPHYLRLLNKPFYHVMHRRGYGVFACRALHWVLPCRSEIGLKNFVISFNVQDETFVEVYQPDYEIKSHDFQLDVGVLEGQLCLMCNYEYESVDIWVMKEYGVKESWTRVFTFTSLKMTGKLLFVRPLVYSKDGPKVLLEVNNQKLIWFDWERKRAERVRVGDSPNTFGAEMYVESLLPIGDVSEVIERESVREDMTADDKMRDDFLSVGFNLKL